MFDSDTRIEAINLTLNLKKKEKKDTYDRRMILF